MTDLPILIRAFRETDRAFILDSWVNTMTYSCPALFWVPSKVIRAKYRAMIDGLIDARPELFRVLVNESDEDQIFAWACREGIVTHFVYVKEDFRRTRLGSTLWGDEIFSNWTQVCEKIHDISYEPSLFKELINGINQTMGHRTAQTGISDGTSLRENHTT